MRRRRIDEVAARRTQREIERDIEKIAFLTRIRDLIRASSVLSPEEQELCVEGLCSGMSAFMSLERLDRAAAWHASKRAALPV